MVIPSVIFLQVIGKGSCNISAIKLATNTQIEVDKHNKHGSNRVLTIRLVGYCVMKWVGYCVMKWVGYCVMKWVGYCVMKWVRYCVMKWVGYCVMKWVGYCVIKWVSLWWYCVQCGVVG